MREYDTLISSDNQGSEMETQELIEVQDENREVIFQARKDVDTRDYYTGMQVG